MIDAARQPDCGGIPVLFATAIGMNPVWFKQQRWHIRIMLAALVPACLRTIATGRFAMTNCPKICPMQQWEYRQILLSEFLSPEQELEALNVAGVKGWELVGIAINDVAYLKRQVPTMPGD